MRIRKSEEADLARMMQIFCRARKFMAEQGNPVQWGATNWPPEELVREDIRSGNSYVCLNEDGQVIGTFYYIFGEEVEPTYKKIYDGVWKDAGPYGVVHRIASDGTVKGTGEFCLNWAYAQCGHLRIDTHGDNLPMQGLLKKLGFVRCGIIYIKKDPYPRLAFEKSERMA